MEDRFDTFHTDQRIAFSSGLGCNKHLKFMDKGIYYLHLDSFRDQAAAFRFAFSTKSPKYSANLSIPVDFLLTSKVHLSVN